jgi:hypothetical protein
MDPRGSYYETQKRFGSMKRFPSVCALALAVGACGGSTNPFSGTVTAGTGTTTTATTTAIPEAVQSALANFTYDPTQDSIVITGVSVDGSNGGTAYRRRANLDIIASDGSVAYQAYTAQAGPLLEHSTNYVKTIGDVTAAVAITGGQFRHYSGGTLYTRDPGEDYEPIVDNNGDGVIATYAGKYIGLSNVWGVDTDLLPLTGTIDSSVVPHQASIVNGTIRINVDFSDKIIKGGITQRTLTVPEYDPLTIETETQEVLPTLLLVPTTVADDGTFSGEVEIPNPLTVGTYAGILGGPDSNAIAGGLFADNHFDDQRVGEEEYGIFVLGRCGTTASNGAIECTTGESN